MSERIKVGTLTIKEPIKHNLSYEVAAWYTELELEAGTYEITARLTDSSAVYLQAANVPAVIVQNYTPSLFGGMAIGGRDGSEENGKKTSTNFSVYPSMLESSNLKIELTKEAQGWLKPGYGWLINFESPEYENLKHERRINDALNRAVNQAYGYTIDYAEEYGFLERDKISNALKDGVSEWGYPRVIAMDACLRKYSGKGLDDLPISYTKAMSYSKDMSGEVKMITAKATKLLMDEYGISPVIDSDKSLSI